MCGIAGIVHLDGCPVSGSELSAMNCRLSHRGPDDEGYLLIDPIANEWRSYRGDGTCTELNSRMLPVEYSASFSTASIGLAHRRFSIVDLSVRGHQPFRSWEEDGYAVAFNGEIYNYAELRIELKALGCRFYTESDTEVLLEAYKVWGDGCFSRFNGFWAAAIYDPRKKKVILSRDRVGKKPLFYGFAGRLLYFASEIKALLAIPAISESRALNERVLRDWLLFGRKNMSAETFFRGIQSLPAGCLAVVDDHFPANARNYWSLPAERMREKNVPVRDAIAQLRALLADAVVLRRRADVATCVELSGGMDSSALAAFAAMEGGSPVTAFTVRFPEKEWNEEEYARGVAERFGLEYRVVDNPPEAFWSDVTAFTYLQEEPYHAPNLQTNQQVWRLMREAGIRVSLNGAGGDEVFAGYAPYMSHAIYEALAMGRFAEAASNLLKHTETGSPWRATLKHLARCGVSLLDDHLPVWRRFKTNSRLLSLPCMHGGLGRGLSLSAQLRSDVTRTLLPYWLCSGDRSAMGIPLEVRAPLLDHRVVEFAFSLPIAYLIKDGWHKWILRKSLEGLLPGNVVWRRKKLGFPFPYSSFIERSAPFVDLLFSASDNPYIRHLSHPSLRNDWHVISFLLWYEFFINRNGDLFRRLRDLGQARGERPDFGFMPAYRLEEERALRELGG